MKKTALSLFVMLLMLQCFGQKQSITDVTVNLNAEQQKMKPIWAWFGYDEPNYTYMKDGKKLLSEISALSPVPVFVRAHSLLVSGDGVADLKWGSTNAYTEDAYGNPIYNWSILDSIFDTYVKRGMKPLAQIGFMPQALSTHPEPYKHHWKPGDPYSDIYTGWAYPPKDYHKWGELVYQWVKHCVERYGEKEVESWYWELWNEPNSQYWQGTQQEFFKLYDYSASAVKRALPSAKIGGANITGGGTKFLEAFIKHCLFEKNAVTGEIGTPLEIILFHAKGSPKIVNGKVVMNVSNQMKNVDNNLRMIAKYPQLKNVPIVIGESDPEGCAACGMKTDPQNAYRNGTMYSSYTAASFARIYELANKYQSNLIGAVTWSFEFENQPWFYGYRDLATNGVNKPVLNVFRMFGMMEGNFVSSKSNQMYALQTVLDSSIRKEQTDLGVLAVKSNKSATVMLWNYHDEDIHGNHQSVALKVDGIPAKEVRVSHYRIDETHSNSYSVWQKMGSPQNPSELQIKELEKAGQLALLNKTYKIKTKKNLLKIDLNLPNQAVSLIKMEW
jgi:xylan 1,4-beta-xylosidase